MPKNEKNINCKQKPLLLFSPLDWGLGHVTRSMPLLKEFIENGWEVVVACNSTQKKVLEAELPALKYTLRRPLNMKYGQNSLLTRVKVGFQLLKILIQINEEKRWTSHFLRHNHVDAILSDNCYGVFSPSVPSIFITHQLRPRSGLGDFTDLIVQRLLNKYINCFNECWIPDYKDGKTLSGSLSHFGKFPQTPVKYIGALSRLKCIQKNDGSLFDLLVIISGPEPQRTIFEQLVASEISGMHQRGKNLSVVVIRGLPDVPVAQLNCRARQFNHISAEQLSELASSAKFVLSRSGYTTIMDMFKLKKNLIVVPTPGQTEQEYLAQHLQKNKIAVVAEQKNFSLEKAIQKAESFDYNFPDVDMNYYKKVVKDFTSEITS